MIFPHLENDVLPELLGNLVLRDEEVDQALDHERGGGLAGVSPGHDHHDGRLEAERKNIFKLIDLIDFCLYSHHGEGVLSSFLLLLFFFPPPSPPPPSSSSSPPSPSPPSFGPPFSL